MRFQKEVNIFAPDAILKRFKTNETNFSVLKGKIEALISESEIIELQNNNVTMYSKLADVKLTVDGLTQNYTDISSKYDSVSDKYTSLDAKVAEYKSGVDGLSQNLSQVKTDLRDNYSTTTAINAAIQAKIDGLSSTVSKTYATASDVQQKLSAADATAKGYADAAKQIAIDTAKASTSDLLKSYTTVTQAQSMINQRAESIESKVSSTYATQEAVGQLESWKKEASQKITDSAIISTVTASTSWTKLESRITQTEKDITSKVSKGSIASEINQTAQTVKISASKINFNGLVTANKYFEVKTDGSFVCNKGKIGNFVVKNNSIYAQGTELSVIGNGFKIDGGLKIYCGTGTFSDSTDTFQIFNLAHVTSGGHLVFGKDGSTVCYGASSSKRYKNHISDMTLEDAMKVLAIPVVWFDYKEGYLAEDDPLNGKPVPGMYAEDVAKYYPAGAYNNEEGLVENWNERMIIPAMLKLLQNLYTKVS